MFSRREFLRTGLRTSALVALAPTVPAFLARTARAVGPARDSRILVVIQLDGGNDGINTVVPFADAGYAKCRKVLRLPADQLLKIDTETGLHPEMVDAAKLLESGRLAIVQGVGYPNPNRSHFKSMAIWHSANVNLSRVDVDDRASNATFGWLGQALDDGRKPPDGSAGALFVGSGPLPAALRSRHSITSAITRPEDSVLALKGSTGSAAREAASGDDLARFVRRSTLDAYATSERMAQVLRAEDKGASYPTTELAGQLRIIARLIKGGGGTRVFYASQGSYDTHTLQHVYHGDLLKEFAGAVRALLDDLKAAGVADRVLVLCFSEFGRRVQENGSQGTDHGAGGAGLVMGTRTAGGMVGEWPGLTNLDSDGNLLFSVDFRAVYSSLLEQWFGHDAASVIPGAGQLPRYQLVR
jgi:uncharacterized protein (DUF1501 family)